MSTDTTWLDDSYELPKSEGNYFKIPEGTTKIRILSRPITGKESWISDKPVRYRDTDGNIPSDAKAFWAVEIWNYDTANIQVWNITQKTIMESIIALTKDADYGNPLNYDLKIQREGKDMNTKYAVLPSPPKPVDSEIAETSLLAGVKLERLFTGDDPFND